MLGIGLVGCGGIAVTAHLPALAKAGGRVVAIADSAESRLQELEEDGGVSARYLHHRQLLEDPAVDVVAVCVPTEHHAEVVRDAAAAGKHVFVEKPLTRTVDSAESVTKAVHAAEIRATVGFNLRSHRLVRRARHVIQSGALGRVEEIVTHWNAEPPARDWQRDRTRGGGVLHELASHHVDLWRFLLGTEVDAVSAKVVSSEFDDDGTDLEATLGIGAQARSRLTFGEDVRHDVEVRGARGRIGFSCYDARSFVAEGSAQRSLAGRVTAFTRDVAAGLRGGDFRDSYVRQWRRFLAAIGGDGTPACTVDDGLRAVEVIAAAYRSVEAGAPVEIGVRA